MKNPKLDTGQVGSSFLGPAAVSTFQEELHSFNNMGLKLKDSLDGAEKDRRKDLRPCHSPRRPLEPERDFGRIGPQRSNRAD